MPSFAPRSTTSTTILRNITIDDSDSSLVYSQGWTKSASQNAFGGAFSTTSQVGDIVQFFLPQNAVAIYYNGFKQPGGGVCGVCLDCDAKGSGNLQTIDSHSDTDDTAPTTLFSKMDIDPSTTHSFSLVNFPDGNFGNKGTTTVDSFIITIQGDAALPSASDMGSDANIIPNSASSVMPLTDVATSSASLSSSSSSSSTSTSASASTSAVSTSTNTSADTSGTSKPTPLAIAGIAVAALLAGCTVLYALMYFMRRRRRARDAPAPRIQQYQLPPKAPMVQVPGVTSKAEFFSATRTPSASAGIHTDADADRDPFADAQRVTVTPPPPRALTPGLQQIHAHSRTASSSSSSSFLANPRPETQYIENPFLAAEVEARTRTLLAERGFRPHQQQTQTHSPYKSDYDDSYYDSYYDSEAGQSQSNRPVSTMTTMTAMNPLPMPNLHGARRKNSWELL